MDFSLPDPLPEMLPDETKTAYRRRVIPGHDEKRQLDRRRKKWDDRNEDSYGEWSDWFPDDAARLSYLRENVRTVVFDA